MLFSLKEKNIPSSDEKQQGFTLVEIAIVMIIFGIITIPLIDLYSRYVSAQKRETTVSRVEEAIAQLKIYRLNSNAAPCPADRTLSINDAQYGIEDCTAAAALPATGGCTPNNGICRVVGARTPWASSTPSVTGRDSVLIGAYPFRSVGFTNGGSLGADAGVDGWQNKLTYAVTDSATNVFGNHTADARGKDFKYGVISAVDEEGNNTAGINNDALFVVLSHGSTAAGAYSANGQLLEPCNLTAKDGENCNNNAIFRRAIGNSEGEPNKFYDDYAYFFRDESGELWGYVYNPASASSTGHIRNLNDQNVGINTGATTPASRLTVAGGIRAETALTNVVCNSANTNCIPTSYFKTKYDAATTIPVPAGAGAAKQWRNSCAAGQVVTGISNGIVQCAASIPIPAPPGGLGANCPTNAFITTIYSNGCIKCTDGVVYPSSALCN